MADMVTEDKEVIYISGPMTGYEDWNFPAFHAAAERLRDAGFAVINPAENIGGEADMTAEWFMGLDITMIVTRCDSLVMLPGWPDSDGAKVEVMVADAVGLPIYQYREEGLPIGKRIVVGCSEIMWSLQVAQEAAHLCQQEYPGDTETAWSPKHREVI